MRRLALIVASSCAACSLISDLSDLGGSADSAAEVGIDVATDVTITDAGEAGNAYAFSDDFNRADSGAIGNGWIAKSPGFALASDRALRVNQSSSDFRDLVVYRPPAEAYLDIQASMEVVLSGIDGGGGAWEQLHVRIQPSTITIPGTLDAYIMFAQGGGTTAMTIARQRLQTAYVVLGTFQLTNALVAGATYRFTLHTTGAGPVTLYGAVERFDSPTWTMLGSTTIQDLDTAQAIVTPGVVGFSASSVDPTGAYSYDNFVASGN